MTLEYEKVCVMPIKIGAPGVVSKGFENHMHRLGIGIISA